jgi:hypothetical protein
MQESKSHSVIRVVSPKALSRDEVRFILTLKRDLGRRACSEQKLQGQLHRARAADLIERTETTLAAASE